MADDDGVRSAGGMADRTFFLPYGRGRIEARIPVRRVAGVLTPSVGGMRGSQGEKGGRRYPRTVGEAMDGPIGGPRLSELAVGKKRVVIIVSDHTRPVPSRDIIPPMLAEIAMGSPGAEVTLLVATGLHRAPTEGELRAKLGDGILSKVKVAVHDCDDQGGMANLGRLPSGGGLYVNRLAVEADLLLAEGFIEPHFFAGFSGGPKSVLPGIAGRGSVLWNHCSEFIADPRARAGSADENPIRADMAYAAKAAGLAYIVNVCLGPDGNIACAVAGDCGEAHGRGAEFAAGYYGARAVVSDIAVATNGGYPMDQNAYQAVKGLSAAEACVREGGVIIMAAESADGHGGEGFYRMASDAAAMPNGFKDLMAGIMGTPKDRTEPDQWQAQILARILMRARVILISALDDAVIRGLGMAPARGFDEALAMADTMLGYADGSVTVIPDGVAVIPIR
ncbi:MAG: nickel-dependent lactate racemase [Oscillospiraceae bacterium]|nr:nickel-dependent lactate racemase [Oscillospiraceae bacterium]